MIRDSFNTRQEYELWLQGATQEETFAFWKEFTNRADLLEWEASLPEACDDDDEEGFVVFGDDDPIVNDGHLAVSMETMNAWFGVLKDIIKKDCYRNVPNGQDAVVDLFAENNIDGGQIPVMPLPGLKEEKGCFRDCAERNKKHQKACALLRKRVAQALKEAGCPSKIIPYKTQKKCKTRHKS